MVYCGEGTRIWVDRQAGKHVQSVQTSAPLKKPNLFIGNTFKLQLQILPPNTESRLFLLLGTSDLEPLLFGDAQLGWQKKVLNSKIDKSWRDYQYKGAQTGPGAHPFSCSVGELGSFPIVKMTTLHLMPMLWIGGILTPLSHALCRYKCSSFVVWPPLLFHFWYRGLLLHPITLINIHTLGRTPLDEWSARRRDLYLYNTQHSQEISIPCE